MEVVKNSKNSAILDFREMYLKTWDIMTETTLEVFDAMPSEGFSYKPTESNYTFSEQFIHIGFINNFLTHTFIEGEKVPFEEPSADGMTQMEIRQFVVDSLAYTRNIVAGMNENDLNTKVPFGLVRLNNVRELSKQMILVFLNNHVGNHRAKANLYLRMNGITPPPYKF